MAKILVVGGAGYIGAHVCKAAAKKGLVPVVFDNLSAGRREFVRWGPFFKGDLSKPSDLARCFKSHRVSAVMHFAAHTAVGESMSDPAKYYSNNVVNTLNLLNAMRSGGVARLVFSSSAAVYGTPVRVPISETHQLAPINPYGRTKLMMEQVMSDYSAAYGLKYAALRYFNAAGADPCAEVGEVHDPETHLIPLALAAASGRGALRVFGNNYPTKDGTCVRDYVHVSDLGQAHVQALRYLERGGESTAFNLGNGRGFTVLDVVRAAEKASGLKVPFAIAPRRAGDPAFLVASSAKASRILGWHPEYRSLQDIVGHAWGWHCKAAAGPSNTPRRKTK